MGPHSQGCQLSSLLLLLLLIFSSPSAPYHRPLRRHAAMHVYSKTSRVRRLLEGAESGHHLQNHLFLARLRSASCLCTRTSPRRWRARAGAGMSFWGIVFLGVAT